MSTTDDLRRPLTGHTTRVELGEELIAETGAGLRIAEIGLVILLGLLVCPPLLILAVIVAAPLIAISLLVAAVVAAIAVLSSTRASTRPDSRDTPRRTRRLRPGSSGHPTAAPAP